MIATALFVLGVGIIWFVLLVGLISATEEVVQDLPTEKQNESVGLFILLYIAITLIVISLYLGSL